VVALALALNAGTSGQRNLLLGMAFFFLVCAFLPVSRGGVVIAFVGCASVMYAARVPFLKTIFVASLIGAVLAIWVPDAVWYRMTFSMDSSQGRLEDSRARVFMAAVEHLPEYVLTGVGAGNFYGPWGLGSKFGKNGRVGGAHNVFFQLMIYWGLAGLLSHLAVLWQVYRCLPKRCKNDGLAVCLLGMSVGLLLLMMVNHTFYNKEYALGLGLLVGARLWIWPKGISESTSVKSDLAEQRHLHPVLRS